MGSPAESQGPREAAITEEILRLYQEVLDNPEGEFHFFHGRTAAELFDYEPAWLDRAPVSAVACFAGVGNPHLRSNLQRGEVVLDLGSGAGLDSLIASWQVGPAGKVIGVDQNPSMCRAAEAHLAHGGAPFECRGGSMEEIPVEDASVDIILSNGVINLSSRKQRVIQEMARALKPAGRISITDIVSAKQLSQSIVNDPRLWAS